MAKVSVIIPTFNRPESLGRAIQSVSHQVFKDYDIFVVHNGGIINGTKVNEKVYRFSIFMKKMQMAPLREISEF